MNERIIPATQAKAPGGLLPAKAKRKRRMRDPLDPTRFLTAEEQAHEEALIAAENNAFLTGVLDGIGREMGKLKAEDGKVIDV